MLVKGAPGHNLRSMLNYYQLDNQLHTSVNSSQDAIIIIMLHWEDTFENVVCKWDCLWRFCTILIVVMVFAILSVVMVFTILSVVMVFQNCNFVFYLGFDGNRYGGRSCGGSSVGWNSFWRKLLRTYGLMCLPALITLIKVIINNILLRTN